MQARRDEWAQAVGRSPDSIAAVVLVEGPSDKAALEALAARRGRNLDGDGVMVIAMGGVTNLAYFLDVYGPRSNNLEVAGLYDSRDQHTVSRGLEAAGFGSGLGRRRMEKLGFYACVEDLEDELIRALGVEGTLDVIAGSDAPGSLRTFRHQPAHRGRPLEAQLRNFVTNWKITYARLFVEALDLDRVPRPLEAVLARC